MHSIDDGGHVFNRWMTFARLGGGLALLAAMATGCSSSSTQSGTSTALDPDTVAARTVVEQFVTAWSQSDVAAICRTTSSAAEQDSCWKTVENLKPSGKDLRIGEFAVRLTPHPIGLASATGTWCIVGRCTTVDPPGKSLPDPSSAQFDTDWNAAQFKSASAGRLLFSLQKHSGKWYVQVGG